MEAYARPNPRRLEVLQRAAKQWQDELRGASSQNPLFRYTHLQTGTLDLTPGQSLGLNPSELDRLLGGRVIQSTKLFPENLFTAEPIAQDVRKRLTAIYRQARENLEEKGIDTLHLAIGMATWTVDSGALPRSPVILVPIDITPDGVGRWNFTIELAGEPYLNPLLAHELRTQHGLDLPEEEEITLPASFGAVRDLLRQFEQQWAKAPGMDIQPWVVIRNFRYTNMRMVADLGEENLDVFAANDFVAAIAGVKEARDAVASKVTDPSPSQPDVDPPESEFLILDADSSQHRAINRVLGGESLVIWGPPGTGKSQTIANLITALAAAGKRVLFVAEKRAAIDVVAARLKHAGLNDLVMDLHGGIHSKRAFAQAMEDSIRAIRTTPLPDNSSLHERLQGSRNELIAHMRAMHDIRQPYGVSLFELQERLIALPETARVGLRITAEHARRLNAEAIELLKADTQHWIDLEGPYLSDRYPGWASSNVSTTEEAREAFELTRTLADRQLKEAERLVLSLSEEIGIPMPDSAPEQLELLEWLADVQCFQQEFGADVYQLDIDSLRSHLAPAANWGDFLTGLFSPSYRSAKRQVRAVLLTRSTDIPDRTLLHIIEQAHDQLGKWAELGGAGIIPLISSSLHHALSAVASVVKALQRVDHFFPAAGLSHVPLARLQEECLLLASQPNVAANLPEIRAFERRLQDTGFGQILELAGKQLSPEYAPRAIEHSWLSAVWDDISFEDRHVSGFNSAAHNRHWEEFKLFDKQHLAATPTRIKRKVAENATQMMNLYPGEAQLVAREAAKKNRHIPVRRLFRQASHVLTAIRPCWAMSPLTVAELIPPEAGLFDVVIFDEASQVRPAEAIGSLVRAPQAVIAGDDRQLPPTSFFRSNNSDASSEEDNEEEEQDDGPLTSDMESILDVAKAGPLREEMLQWHYRSRDGRLIAFSNSKIYKEALTAFPDTAGKPPISHHLVPHRPLPQKSTVSHPDEVAKVVELALAHAYQHPDQSLGIIAFGLRHANNIEEELRRRLRAEAETDPVLEEFFSDSIGERFFVKNLETVQGDERDVIILSVGYHKNVNGSLIYRFGPINDKEGGGERRLNVAVTRARLHMHVVSSFSHHDMDPTRSGAPGVERLRQYLEFAASGGEQLAASASNEPLNAFELDILYRLKERDIPVTPQYGVAGYRIDFACGHPDQPGRMVLAIEADGAAYHSGKTARERDRLRQSALEDRGWTFHRIWSTNWFKYRNAELDLAVAAWKNAVARSDSEGPYTGNAAEEDGKQPILHQSAPPATAARAQRPWVPPGRPIGDYTMRELVGLAQWILSDTLLRTDDDLKVEMRKELGFKRNGSRINEALSQAIRIARQRTRQ